MIMNKPLLRSEPIVIIKYYAGRPSSMLFLHYRAYYTLTISIFQKKNANLNNYKRNNCTVLNIMQLVIRTDYTRVITNVRTKFRVLHSTKSLLAWFGNVPRLYNNG